tara:strand:+ start:678 stop:869 length:192 start_codon:yes stop_codon:yes gene_type:complete
MKKTKLKRCLRCLNSKTILAEIIYYGKLNYACHDCAKIILDTRIQDTEVGIDGTYTIPDFLKN